ncbi:MAG: RdgB/HAM1 family non-canonical purine NTP pyrophosphatase [Chthoniobacterales bacterium]
MSNLPCIILATRNPHKTREFQELLGRQFAVGDLSAYPQISLPPETGTTFEENATLKALGLALHLNGPIIGDDSGLEVDALDGEPGIYSARYAGEDATDQQNIEKLLHELTARHVPADARSARFRCSIAFARDGELLGTFTGVVNGRIVDPPRGRGGFGYDPVFQPDGFELTFAEMPDEMKNRISHRAQAVQQFLQFLRTGLPEVKK